jgi:hypothetical protein
VAGGLRGEALEAGLGGGVAVDRDQSSIRTESVGDATGVAASAEGAVDGGLPRPGRKQVGQLGG